jgi:hypothetical protein
MGTFIVTRMSEASTGTQKNIKGVCLHCLHINPSKFASQNQPDILNAFKPSKLINKQTNK